MNRLSDCRQRTAATAMIVIALAGLATPSFGAADAVSAIQPVTARSGDHDGFGRLVFDLPPTATVQTVIEGSRVLLIFNGAPAPAQPSALPRHVLAFKGDGTTVTLTLSPGTTARPLRLSGRLVIDVSDSLPRQQAPKRSGPPPDRPITLERPPTPIREPAQPQPKLAMDPHPSLAEPTPSPSPAVTPVAEPAGPTSAPVVAVQQSILPEHAAVQTMIKSNGLLIADAGVGAAAFRRGDWGLIVLDRKLPLTVPASLAGAKVTFGAVTTIVKVPLPGDAGLSLERQPGGWFVSTSDPSTPAQGVLRAVADGVSFPMPRPARSVMIQDPVTGGTLLVGTSLADGLDSAFAPGRHMPAFTTLSTWLGVAIEPSSDLADLHAGPSGFVLTGGSLPDEPVVNIGAGHRLDLPADAEAAWINRLSAQLLSAANAPPRARTRPRIAAVQSMIALGLGVEAQALVQRITVDDPEAANDIGLGFLGAVAAVIARRSDEAGALDAPELADEQDARLWRGLRDRRLGLETPAARGLPVFVKTVLAYPGPLRRLIWPDVAEAAAAAGVPVPDNTMPPYAQALALEHAGRLDEALVALDRVIKGTDQQDQFRAVTHSTELKLASGRITPAEAADVMERQTLLWRGDAQELSTRLRAAELRAAAGGWKAALDTLRATDEIFPEQRDAIGKKKSQILETMLQTDGTKLAALDLVLVAADYADCLSGDAANSKLAKLLADKLVALDLPARAIPVLQGLIQRTPPGPARAGFGLGLAQLLLDGGDPAAAQTALQASATEGLSQDAVDARLLLTAKLQLAQGKTPEALAGLSLLKTAASDDLRASLFERQGAWKEAVEALQALADKVVTPSGLLPDKAQDIVIRQATASTHIADPAVLQRLATYLPRMSGAKADMLRVLTEAPITSTHDLARAANELKLARAIPKQIQSVEAR